MVRIGVHVSIAGSIDRAVDRAIDRRCDTFQIFTRNPRGWKFGKLNEKSVEAFRRKVAASGIDPVVDHMPYLANLACPKKAIYSRSVRTLCVELNRCYKLDIPYLVTHLGSHLGKGADVGLERICGALNQALSTVGNHVMILLENTAGAKNSVGTTFEEIRSIIDGVIDVKRIGVCFDTCHGFAAGYELRTKEALDTNLEHFDRVIGIGHLKIVHINDSRGKLGSHLDRHEHIGMGSIGEEGFRLILRHQTLKKLPMILETPIDQRRDDRGNLEKVRSLA